MPSALCHAHGELKDQLRLPTFGSEESLASSRASRLSSLAGEPYENYVDSSDSSGDDSRPHSFSLPRCDSSSILGRAASCSVSEFLAESGLASCKSSRLLGTGATCSVHLVTIHLPFGGTVTAARKTLPRHSDPHLRAKDDGLFARELEGLRAGSASPFVVRQLGTAVHDDRCELLLELAEGNTLEHELSEAMRRVPGLPTEPILPLPRLAELGASLLSALTAYHRQHYAHLDVKPANVLLTSSGRLMLGDAGCCLHVGEEGLTTLTLASGTPLFAAPELKAPRRPGLAPPAISTAADMYSVGVLLAVAVAFHRQTGRVLGFLRGDVPLPEFVPAPLKELITRLVAADPAVRPTAEEALAHPFFAGVDLASLEPRRSSAAPPQ
ncbi:hypothetical protein HYH03_018139 [Edaphochlamys debaryana]|uniref:Protein kinase domain-containing protein n=1 Tax=Edaphochlamys debaryana TaxID=47281 RepID=A0A835XH32_9CHLO|nr:hypothetical protein HYH03_018139 [Edaphochlamys debaryana]|eukprot:KAG2482962.1 hypothetical protein HYH03_018139 [Edaphochlamys debaryana]